MRDGSDFEKTALLVRRRLGKSLVVQVAAVEETEWKSRDETVLTFAGDLEPLVIGRSAALRLRDLLTGEDAGPTAGA